MPHSPKCDVITVPMLMTWVTENFNSLGLDQTGDQMMALFISGVLISGITLGILMSRYQPRPTGPCVPPWVPPTKRKDPPGPPADLPKAA